MEESKYYSVYIKNNTAYIKEEESYVINNIYKHVENKNIPSFETNPTIFGINKYLEDITAVVYCNYKDFKNRSNCCEISIFCNDENYRSDFVSIPLYEANRILKIINNVVLTCRSL